MKLNIIKKCSINMIRCFFGLVMVSFCYGCSTLNNIETEQDQTDKTESWRYDPFMHRTSKVVPMVSKTVILPSGNKEKVQEQEE